MRRTTVVNKRKEAWDVYIGRGSAFGNPFVIGQDGTRKECIEKYGPWFEKKLKSARFRTAVLRLKGKRLA